MFILRKSKLPEEPKSVFGQIKSSLQTLSAEGLEKVGVEFGLLAITHKLGKLCRK